MRKVYLWDSKTKKCELVSVDDNIAKYRGKFKRIPHNAALLKGAFIPKRISIQLWPVPFYRSVVNFVKKLYRTVKNYGR